MRNLTGKLKETGLASLLGVTLLGSGCAGMFEGPPSTQSYVPPVSPAQQRLNDANDANLMAGASKAVSTLSLMNNNLGGGLLFGALGSILDGERDINSRQAAAETISGNQSQGSNINSSQQYSPPAYVTNPELAQNLTGISEFENKIFGHSGIALAKRFIDLDGDGQISAWNEVSKVTTSQFNQNDRLIIFTGVRMLMSNPKLKIFDSNGEIVVQESSAYDRINGISFSLSLSSPGNYIVALYGQKPYPKWNDGPRPGQPGVDYLIGYLPLKIIP